MWISFYFFDFVTRGTAGDAFEKSVRYRVNDAGVAREGPGFDLAFLHIFFSKLCPWEGVC